MASCPTACKAGVPLGQAMGLPACCVLTNANNADCGWMMLNSDTILIFRIGSIGDTVVALPCFHHVARCYPSARRILITDTPASRKAAPAEAVLVNSGLIDDVIYFPASRRLSDL